MRFRYHRHWQPTEGCREEKSFVSTNIYSTNGISRYYVLHATMVCAVHVLGEIPTGTGKHAVLGEIPV